MAALLAVALGILLVNVPFGYWRARARRFSAAWLAAVHLPIPLGVGLRLLAGVEWRFATFPVLLGAYVAGQYVGGALRRRVQRQSSLDSSP